MTRRLHKGDRLEEWAKSVERSIELNVAGCPRCKGDHGFLVFEPDPYTEALDGGAITTHRARCPVENQPIRYRWQPADSIVCYRTRGRMLLCYYCNNTHTKLCDWPVGYGGERSCDRPICDDHARHAGKNRDYCHHHQPGRTQ